jgi:hypothetical protein
MDCMQEEECVRKLVWLGVVEPFKVRSPRCWPIRADEFSAACEAPPPPRLGLSDMSSLLNARMTRPQRPPGREFSLNPALHQSIHELPGSLAWSVHNFRTLISRCFGTLGMLSAQRVVSLCRLRCLFLIDCIALESSKSACCLPVVHFWHFNISSSLQRMMIHSCASIYGRSSEVLILLLNNE